MKKLLAIAALLSAPALAHANLVVNGSFEDYSVGPKSWSTFYNNSNVAGWTVGDLGIEIRNNVAGKAADGVRFAELDTTGNSWISQIIHTNANQALELSFSYAPRVAVPKDSNGIEVYWNDKLLGKAEADGSNGSIWFDLSYAVSADAQGSGVLKFAAIGNSDRLGGSLDNISVTTVPEPGSASMLLAGPGILAAVVRRRRA